MDSHENVIVGGGVDALMTAYMLKLKDPGADIKIVTKNGDPRLLEKDGSEFYVDSQGNQLDGSTWKGLVNRYITLFEGHNYTDNTATYPDMDFMFQHLITEGGWLGKEIGACSEEEIQWLAKRVTACCEENKVFKEDLFELYVKYNQFAMNWWHEMRENQPALFEDVDLIPGVARVYDNKELYEAAKALHEKYDGLAKTDGALSADNPEDLKKIKTQYPHFYHAIESGFVKGGVLLMDEERSFTFNIHKFAERLMTYLEEHGVEIQFNTEIQSIKMNETKQITGLSGIQRVGETEEKAYAITGTNVVVSTGAYAGKLLEGTPAEYEINGVAGGWVMLPAPEGIKQSFKVHGDRYFALPDGEMKRYGDMTEAGHQSMPEGTLRPVADQNHKIIERDGKQYIVIGGGYAWVGSDPHSISDEQKKAMQEENLRIARALYGEHFDKAMEADEVVCWDDVCVRSFTTNDVPLFAIGETSKGGKFVINGGMNTGTTTAAPTTANIISDILDERVGSEEYKNRVNAARGETTYSAQAFLDNIREMNQRWNTFMTEGKGKELLDRHQQALEKIAADFRDNFGESQMRS